jgi:hypothetical protein
LPEKNANESEQPRYGIRNEHPIKPSREVVVAHATEAEGLSDLEWKRWLELQKEKHQQHITWAISAPIIAVLIGAAVWVLRWGFGLL